MDADEKDIREWFKDHKHKSFTGADQTIFWDKPGTSKGAVIYNIVGTYLMVRGNIGAAIYQWPEEISLKFLADCEWDYFAEKCVASEHGKGFKIWDGEAALEFIKEHLEAPSELWTKFQARKGEDALYSKNEWHEWLRLGGPALFGDNWWELGEIGMVVSPECKAHLIGLKMIAEMKKAGG